ncbi:MAG: ATP-binding protein [Bacteroidaceae bacterium]|nr:ATP-binding protein [Bacteroidaceae bacterium]MBR1755391.1 ATP-binding protein [Bacteroidaceae bacterium]
MTGNYIKRIEIDSLWKGVRHIVWDLQPGVNVLSGINGVGKSTILRKTIRQLTRGKDELERDYNKLGVHLTFSPEEADSVRFDVIRGVDRPLVSADILARVTEARLTTELDWQLYQLQRRFLDYQVNQSNRIVALFTAADPEAQAKAAEIAAEKGHFQDLVDELFKATGKRIDRSSNEIFFLHLGERITPYLLSSGEKQMLIILLTVLVEDRQPYVLLMDEPEISLHIEWQQRLLELITDLNPNAQVILTTHSPAVIMSGWGDCVTDVEDIIVNS